MRDAEIRGRYLTIDYWTSETAYDRFRTIFRGEYEALDKKCESLNDSEFQVGVFVSDHENKS